MLVKFAAKAQGESHIEKDTPCQDAATACIGRNNTVGIACVADGHGGVKYFRSDKGSVMAVQVAEKALLDFCGTIAREKAAFFDRKAASENANSSMIQSKLKELEGNIIYTWRNAVMQDIEKNPFTESEIEFCKKNNVDINAPANAMFVYGSTLLAGLVSDNFWFALQIGDGLCVVLESHDNVSTPIADDERLAFGRTTSLCDNDAIDNFREAYGFGKIDGFTVATDGITDSFAPEKYLRFNKELYGKFNQFSVKDAEKELLNFLPAISERGSRDDISIAGIFRLKEQ